MLSAIADTHAVIWYIFDDDRMSEESKTFLDNAAIAGHQVGFSVITLAEIVYLSEKGRIHPDTLTRVLTALDTPESVLVDVPFDRSIAQALLQVDRSVVPDLPDRIIAATALSLGVPLISRDRKIQMSDVETIW